MNKYNVIHINVVNFLSESQNMDEMIEFVEEDLIDELKNEYPDIRYPKRQNLIKIIAAIFSQTNIPFIFIIDEWDCIFREHQNDTDAQKLSRFSEKFIEGSKLHILHGFIPYRKNPAGCSFSR